MRKQAREEQDTKDVLNPKQLADFMGVSIGWVYKNKQQLPHRRIGKMYFFHKATVEQWLSDGYVPDPLTTDEREKVAVTVKTMNMPRQMVAAG